MKGLLETEKRNSKKLASKLQAAGKRVADKDSVIQGLVSSGIRRGCPLSPHLFII